MNREIVIQDWHVAWLEGELELSKIPMLWKYLPQTPPQSRSSELKTQFSFESSENILQNRRKMPFGLILALFGAKRGPKTWPTGAIFHTHLEVHTICL